MKRIHYGKLCVGALAVGIALAGSVARGVQEFRLINPSNTAQKPPHEAPPFVHWDLREMPDCKIPWAVGTAPAADLDGDLNPGEDADSTIAQGVFQYAVYAWEGVSPSLIGFTYAAGPGTPAGGHVVDSYNTLSFSTTALPAGVNAATVVHWNPSTGVIQEADIVFNSSLAPLPNTGIRRWKSFGDGADCKADLDLPPLGNWPDFGDGDTDDNGNNVREWEIDLGTIARHEFGHLVGLHHVDTLGGATNNTANALMEQYWKVGPGIGLFGSGQANHNLKDQDYDGCNFLYCPDLGDAPDPWMGTVGQYPSLVHDKGKGRTLNEKKLDDKLLGAEHVLGIKYLQTRNFTYEWLGEDTDSDVNAECESNQVDKDKHDDGITFYPNPPVWERKLWITAHMRYARDDYGKAHDYSTSKLWASVWVDLDQNCIFDSSERVVHEGKSPAAPPQYVSKKVTAKGSTTLPGPLADAIWVRGRLDWGEDSGAAANVDGTLSGPEGAAQFGEVEDYPLYCVSVYEQDLPTNSVPQDKAGVAMIFVGAPVLSTHFAARVDADDCVIETATWSETYDPTLDELTIEHVPPTLVPPGGRLHAGLCRDPFLPSIRLLRAHWIPADGLDPTQEDLIPTTHLGVTPTNDALEVLVGAPNDSIGGVIGGDSGAWDDSLFVTVSYRVSPELLALEQLSPCDPVYASLLSTPVGSGFVNPEEPFRFTLTIPTDIAPGQYLIVEVNSSWSVNANTNCQMVEFTSIPGVLSGVRGDRSPGAGIAGLDVRSYPNPFNPETTIEYVLPDRGMVSVRVYDVSGRLVRVLIDDELRGRGLHATRWNGVDDAGSPVPSGVYFVRVDAGAETATRKIVLLK